MAIEVSGELRRAALTILLSERPLTSGQKAALRQEIADDPAGRGYAGKTPAEILELLVADYEIPNPEPRPMLDREEWRPDELKNVLLQMFLPSGISVWGQLELMRESADLQQKAFAIQALATFSLKAINMKNPLVVQGFETIAQAFGLTKDQREFLTKIPDPSWTPTVLAEPRASVVLGSGVMPTLTEISEAL